MITAVNAPDIKSWLENATPLIPYSDLDVTIRRLWICLRYGSPKTSWQHELPYIKIIKLDWLLNAFSDLMLDDKDVFASSSL